MKHPQSHYRILTSHLYPCDLTCLSHLLSSLFFCLALPAPFADLSEVMFIWQLLHLSSLERSDLYSPQSAGFRSLCWESRSIHATQFTFDDKKSKCTIFHLDGLSQKPHLLHRMGKFKDNFLSLLSYLLCT